MPAYPKPDTDSRMALEVDRLLRQLKYPPSSVVARSASRPSSPSMHRPHGAAASELTPAGVWGRVALGVLVAVAVPLWPYPQSCGVSLGLYLAGVSVVVIAGGWAGFASFQRRMGIAHVFALAIALWGGTLAGVEILPRVGYARVEAPWLCGGGS